MMKLVLEALAGRLQTAELGAAIGRAKEVEIARKRGRKLPKR